MKLTSKLLQAQRRLLKPHIPLKDRTTLQMTQVKQRKDGSCLLIRGSNQMKEEHINYLCF